MIPSEEFRANRKIEGVGAVSLPSGWIFAPLESIFKLTSGKTKPADFISPDKRQKELVPVYGGNGISGFSNFSLVDSPRIIIGRVGEYCGCVHLSNGPTWITDNALYTREFDKSHNLEYFFYLLTYQNLSRLRSKGGQPLISQGPIHSLIVPIPPLPEQKKIAGILSCWDRGIETIKIIEQKMDLFMNQICNQFYFSKKYKEVTLGDLMILHYGKSSASIICKNGKFPVIGTGGEIGRTNIALVNEPTIIIGRKGTISRPQLLNSPCWPIDTTYFVSIKPDVDLFWLYYYLHALKLETLNESSGIPSLNRENVYSTKISTPNFALQKQIAHALKTVDLVKQYWNSYRHQMSLQKQVLMQQLLTGKKRV